MIAMGGGEGRVLRKGARGEVCRGEGRCSGKQDIPLTHLSRQEPPSLGHLQAHDSPAPDEPAGLSQSLQAETQETRTNLQQQNTAGCVESTRS